MKPSLKQLLWIIIGIPLLSLLLLKPTFNLSLFGDDWEQLYFMWLEFEYRHSFSWFDIKSFLGPYNFSYSYLGIINNFFGLNSAAYFYVSFFFRSLSVISTYFLVKFLTKEMLAPFFASLIFIFSAAGLETTNWVFNLNTYMAIFLFNFSVIFYLKFRSKPKENLTSLGLFILLFSAALFAASTRMHGAAPFIILIDLALIFLYEREKPSLISYSRFIIPPLILLILINYGAFGHVGSGGFTDRLKLGMETASALLSKGQYLFLFFFPGIIGHTVLPDTVTLNFKTSTGLFIAITFLSTLVSLLVWLIVNILKFGKTQKDLAFYSFFGATAIWAIIVYVASTFKPIIAVGQFFSIFVGGETIFLILWLFFFLRIKYPQFSFACFFSLFYLLAFSLIYWLFSPAVFFETTSRYLTMGGVGFAMFFGIFLSFLFKKFSSALQVLPIMLLTTWLAVNFWAGREYWMFMETNRNSQLAETIWQSLTGDIKNLDIENPTVFYLTADNPNLLYWNVDFGFPSHMGLTYKVPDLNNTPVSTSDYSTLLEYAKDGSPLKKIHGRPIKEIPLDHIYAYHLTGDKFISYTELIRQKLKEDLKKITSQSKAGY